MIYDHDSAQAPPPTPIPPETAAQAAPGPSGKSRDAQVPGGVVPVAPSDQERMVQGIPPLASREAPGGCDAAPRKGRPGRPVGCHPEMSLAAYRRATGRTAIAKAMASRGLAALEGSPLADEVIRWQAAVVSDLGGDLSEAQRTILGHGAVLHAIALTIATAIGKHPQLCLYGSASRKRIAPVINDYVRVTRALNADLRLLGLRRRAKELPSAVEILEEENP